jgi:hypothetical protein
MCLVLYGILLVYGIRLLEDGDDLLTNRFQYYETVLVLFSRYCNRFCAR